MLVRIPHFREVVISAFECHDCGFKNNEIQSASTICEKGKLITLNVQSEKDLNRHVVLSEYASIRIPDLDFEIPPKTAKGQLTTVEGLINQVLANLAAFVETEGLSDEQKGAISEFLLKARRLFASNVFTLIVDDITGNSYIENTIPYSVEGVKSEDYPQDFNLLVQYGLVAEPSAEVAQPAEENVPEEVMAFMGQCPSCGHSCFTRMKSIEIPYFKETWIMATTCDSCGYKSNEIKTGGAISPLGKRITLSVRDPEDLNRDILKSETCLLTIPEIDLDLRLGSFGGRFTTVEGLLVCVQDQIRDLMPFMQGDSVDSEKKKSFDSLMQSISEILKSEKACTIILDDPLANSYIQNLCAPDSDPKLSVEEYKRTFEQDDEFGLNDIDTEDKNS